MKHAALALLAACNFGNASGTGGEDDAPPPPIDARLPPDAAPDVSVFDPAITTVTVEIDYEPGAEPFTGAILGFGDSFDLSVANVDRLFAGKKELVIPRTLAAMGNLGAVPDEQLTVADLINLANVHRGKRDTATEKTYYVMFVSGYFADANGVYSGVLGVSIADTGVIAMFKDVIRGSGLGNVQRFVEQSSLTHELAHAIGLVNNGVPLTSAHQDTAHGKHCSNQDCVMYWANEGASAMTEYTTRFVLARDSILFRAECLGDVDALSGGP